MKHLNIFSFQVIIKLCDCLINIRSKYIGFFSYNEEIMKTAKWTQGSSSMSSIDCAATDFTTDTHMSPFGHLYWYTGRSIKAILFPHCIVQAPVTT